MSVIQKNNMFFTRNGKFLKRTPPGPITFGNLYNFYAANDPNFAPVDWRLPTDIEIGSIIGGGVKLDYKETGLDHWNTANGTNTTGFTAQGSGYRDETGAYSGEKESFTYWTEDAYYGGNAYIGEILDDGTHNFTIPVSKKYGCSVRLIYTGAGSPTSITDNDGNIYDVINVNGSGYYMTVQPWVCTTYENGNLINRVYDNAAWSGLTTGGYCKYGDI